LLLLLLPLLLISEADSSSASARAFVLDEELNSKSTDSGQFLDRASVKLMDLVILLL